MKARNFLSKRGYMIKKMQECKEYLEDKGLKVLYIGLIGSQNYNLDDEESDFDFKAIVLPNMEDIIFKRTIKKTKVFDFGELTYYDLVSFVTIIKKGNPQMIELVQTPFSIGAYNILPLRLIKVNPKAVKGMFLQKEKALYHPFESKKEIINKYGYDPKQLHHMLRLLDYIKAMNNNYEPIVRYETNTQAHGELVHIKRGFMNINNVIIVSSDTKVQFEIEYNKINHDDFKNSEETLLCVDKFVVETIKNYWEEKNEKY